MSDPNQIQEAIEILQTLSERSGISVMELLKAIVEYTDTKATDTDDVVISVVPTANQYAIDVSGVGDRRYNAIEVYFENPVLTAAGKGGKTNLWGLFAMSTGGPNAYKKVLAATSRALSSKGDGRLFLVDATTPPVIKRVRLSGVNNENGDLLDLPYVIK